MGICYTTSDAQILNSVIDNELSNAVRSETDTKKLVLLGAGGSGKSTFFKQLRNIHGRGYNDDNDRIPFTKQISYQIMQELKRMIRFAEETFEEDPQQNAPYKISDSIMKQVQYFKTLPSLRGDTPFTENIANLIETIWQDQGIHHVFRERSRFAITDSTGFFLDEIQRISSLDYVPSYEDVLLCRQRSVGINDKLFMINGNQFRIFDVGGQRAERRKWIHCFEHVTAVIYVVSLSGYNEIMYEDESENVMQDALCLFEKTINNQWFTNTPVILFLNKSDLFETKIKSAAITCCFPDYKGAHTNTASLAEIERQFKAKNKQTTRPMYVHITCAVDRENVKTVFNDVQSVLSIKLLANLM